MEKANPKHLSKIKVVILPFLREEFKSDFSVIIPKKDFSGVEGFLHIVTHDYELLQDGRFRKAMNLLRRELNIKMIACYLVKDGLDTVLKENGGMLVR